MKIHSKEIIASLKRDRINGSSISQLIARYHLSKTTIWHHIKDITLSSESLKLIRSRQGGSARRSKERWGVARGRAKEILQDVNIGDSWPVLIAALYWAEGTKYSGFVFTNTDEFMIKIFLKILREELEVKDEDIDVLIRTSGTMESVVCRRYWSGVTSIPFKAVRINYNEKQNKSKSKFGMCRLTIRKGGSRLKLMHCLIEEMTAKILGLPAPVVQGTELRTPNAVT